MMNTNPLRVSTKVTKLSRDLTRMTNLPRVLTMMINEDHGAPKRLDGHVQSLNHYRREGANDDNNPLGVLRTNTKRESTLHTMLILPIWVWSNSLNLVKTLNMKKKKSVHKIVTIINVIKGTIKKIIEKQIAMFPDETFRKLENSIMLLW